MASNIHAYLNGALTLAALTIAYFFWRFRKATGDRIFCFFAIAFALLALERACFEFVGGEFQSKVYIIRLFAFILILIGIFDKNRKAGTR
jgi:hypothetical protein